MQERGNDGVSPVIAVILLLMLTILIAGIISALFMGMSSDTVEGMDTGFLQQKQNIKLVYNGNGDGIENIPVDEKTYKTGDTVVVANGSTMHRDGYTFVWWTTNANGSGDGYPSDYELILMKTYPVLYAQNAQIILYAQWNSIQDPEWYFVFYEENREDATLPTSHACAKKNETIDLIGAGPTDEFIGWTTEPDGTGHLYKIGDKYVGDKDVTLYAQWKEEAQEDTQTEV